MRYRTKLQQKFDSQQQPNIFWFSCNQFKITLIYQVVIKKVQNYGNLMMELLGILSSNRSTQYLIIHFNEQKQEILIAKQINIIIGSKFQIDDKISCYIMRVLQNQVEIKQRVYVQKDQ